MFVVNAIVYTCWVAASEPIGLVPIFEELDSDEKVNFSVFVNVVKVGDVMIPPALYPAVVEEQPPDP